jgi:hypothetical protein
LQVEVVVSHTGATAAQSALDTQPTQIFALLHTGVRAAQSALDRQETHRLAVPSHLGVAGSVQSPSTWQATHAPAFMPAVAHAGPVGLPAQSALVWQGLHVWVVVLQMGVDPAQSVSNSQATQVPVGKSQTAVPPVHALPLVAEHCPQAPQTSHAGVGMAHSASDAQARHWPPLHTGLSPPQSALLRHCAQVLVAVQRGAAGGQLASATQSTQLPALAPRVAHCGVAPLQSALLAQARQARVGWSQMGLGAAQSPLLRQPTQALTGTSQTGVAPVHAMPLVAEQTAQMPDAAQAGVAPLHAESPSQAQGTPSVLNSSSRTSCSFISALVPVADVKPTNICVPSVAAKLTAWLRSGVVGLLVPCER